MGYLENGGRRVNQGVVDSSWRLCQQETHIDEMTWIHWEGVGGRFDRNMMKIKEGHQP